MKTTTDGGASAAFNSKIEYDIRAQQLTQDMLQAFYRREHSTITYLASEGARFTPEMLQVAVGFRDPHLTRECLDGGVIPNEGMVKFAIDSRDAPLAHMLLKKTPQETAQRLKDYAARRGNNPAVAREFEHVI